MKNTPRAHLRSISRRLGYAERCADYGALVGYATSDAFVASFVALDKPQRRRVLQNLHRAQIRCLAALERRSGPLLPISAGRHRWDEASIARFRKLYAATPPGDEGARLEEVARKLGLSVEAARLARKRYVDSAKGDSSQKLPRMAAANDLPLEPSS